MDDAPVLTVTINPALDVSVTVDRLLPDHKLRGTGLRRDPGGGGVNVSRVLERLGTPNRCFVVIGGPVGHELVDLLTDEGLVPVTYEIAGRTRESFAITDDTTDQQYRIVVDGPPLDEVDTLIAEIIAQAGTAGVVVLSGNVGPETPPDIYRRIIDALPGHRVIVDCASPALAEAVRGGPFLVKPSRRELASLVGRHPVGDADLEVAIAEVLALGATEAVVASLGPEGAALGRRGESVVWFRPPHVPVVSTVGSGDSMVAGITTALARGADLVDAVRYGAAAGAAAVTTSGTELCRPETIDELLPHIEVVR